MGAVSAEIMGFLPGGKLFYETIRQRGERVLSPLYNTSTVNNPKADLHHSINSSNIRAERFKNFVNNLSLC